MELKKAITLFLSKELNDIYQDIHGLTAERPFVFECDFTRDNGDFMLFDESGKLVIDQYLNYIKYIPCSVYSLIADMIEIPNLQVLDALVPIEMFVDNQRLEETMRILSMFQQEINGKPFQLAADYQGVTQTCNVIFTFNLPSDDDFQIFDGINGKIIDFQISANIAFDVIFGNSIQYELSIDDLETFEPLIKTNPSETLVLTPYSDQIINDDRTRDLPKMATWTLSLNAIVKKDTITETLVPYANIPYRYLDDYIFTKTWLKTNFLYKEHLRPNLSFASIDGSHIWHGCTINLTDIIDALKNSQATTSGNLSGDGHNILFQSNNGDVTVAIFQGGFLLETIYDYQDDTYKDYEDATISIKTTLNVGVDPARKECILTYYSYFQATFSNTFGDGEVVYPNYFIKPVLITQITPNFENADIASLELEFKDRMI